MRCERRLPNAIVAAAVGALLASVLYHLIGGGLFLHSDSTKPIAPSAAVRLLAMLLVTALVAVGAVRGALGRHREPAPVSGS